MSWSDAFKGHHDDVHKNGSVAHDAIAGAISFVAIKTYENYLEKNGKPDNHAKAKELVGSFAAAAVTHLAETKGRELWDDYKKKQVEKKAQEHIDNVLVGQYSSTK